MSILKRKLFMGKLCSRLKPLTSYTAKLALNGLLQICIRIAGQLLHEWGSCLREDDKIWLKINRYYCFSSIRQSVNWLYWLSEFIYSNDTSHCQCCYSAVSYWRYGGELPDFQSKLKIKKKYWQQISKALLKCRNCFLFVKQETTTGIEVPIVLSSNICLSWFPFYFQKTLKEISNILEDR